VRADRHRGAPVSGRDVGEEDRDLPLFGRGQVVGEVVAIDVPAAGAREPRNSTATSRNGCVSSRGPVP
jgi:hypothetical protein